MGEVYRARDTRLKREVAIKVLPQSFALDADRVTRFEREVDQGRAFLVNREFPASHIVMLDRFCQESAAAR